MILYEKGVKEMLEHPIIKRLRTLGYETNDGSELCCPLCGETFEDGDIAIEYPDAGGYICTCCFRGIVDELGDAEIASALGLEVLTV
jgi:hypothetical protein